MRTKRINTVYYTPEILVNYTISLVKWLVGDLAKYSIYEPSAGEGAFIKPLIDFGALPTSITAGEFDSSKEQLLSSYGVNVDIGDSLSHKIDWPSLDNRIVIGNAPWCATSVFTSHPDFNETRRQYSRGGNNKSCSIENHFVGMGIYYTKDCEHSILAYVLPARFMNGLSANRFRASIGQLYDQVFGVDLGNFAFENVMTKACLIVCARGCVNNNLPKYNKLVINNLSDLNTFDYNKFQPWDLLKPIGYPPLPDYLLKYEHICHMCGVGHSLTDLPDDKHWLKVLTKVDKNGKLVYKYIDPYEIPGRFLNASKRSHFQIMYEHYLKGGKFICIDAWNPVPGSEVVVDTMVVSSQRVAIF